MSQSPTTSAATPDVTQDAEPTVVKNGMSHAPVLITPQEVMFSTAAATSSRPASIPRRLIDTIRVVGAALHRPPASTLPAAQQLPRAVAHGARNGPTMSPFRPSLRWCYWRCLRSACTTCSCGLSAGTTRGISTINRWPTPQYIWWGDLEAAGLAALRRGRPPDEEHIAISATGTRRRMRTTLRA